MEYRQHVVPPILRGHVRAIWQLTGQGAGAGPELLVPDGCMELVLNFGDQFEEQTASGVIRQPSVLFVGEMQRPVRAGPTGGIDLLGVRFVPGGASAILDDVSSSAAGGMHDDSALIAPVRRKLAALHSCEPADRLSHLEHVLIDALAEDQRVDRIVRRAVRWLIERDGMCEISELEGELGVSRRHLERRFDEWVGMPPKALAKVLRFRRVLRAIETHEPDWAGLALDGGYSDQSHLIRDFKRYTGLTPRAYLTHSHPLTVLFDSATP